MDGSPHTPASSSANPAPRTGILIATDVKSDGKLLQRQLDRGFGRVDLCHELESAASDFEKHRPRVLLLAFNALSKAQNYSLSLYRRSSLTHDLPHRTIVLCSKDEVASAFTLCEQEIYDDYILYWPLSQDGQRLRMSVLLAMRHLDMAERSSSAAQIARQARQIASLERMVVQAKDQFEAGMSTIEASHPIPRSELNTALEALTQEVVSGRFAGSLATGGSDAFMQQAREFCDDLIAKSGSDRPLLAPLTEWKSAVNEGLRPHLQAIRKLQELSASVKPCILLIENDVAQKNLFETHPGGENYDLEWASTAEAALRMLSRRTPDLIILDSNLPDSSGLELLQKIKSSKSCLSTPVIVVSSHSERSVVIDAIRFGAKSYIVKPIDPTSLLKRVADVLGI